MLIRFFTKSLPVITFKTLSEYLKTIEELASMNRNTSRLRWPRTELQSLSIKTIIVVTRSLFSIRPPRGKNVNRLISNNIKNLINSGMRTF